MIRTEKWTDIEDALIVELKKKGTPISEIAQIVKRSQDATRNRLYVLRKSTELAKNTIRQSWIEGARFGFWDIETSSFDANTGYMLSWCLLLDNDELLFDVIRKKEIFNGTLDKRITKSLLKAFDNIDVVVSYYGTGFDAPYTRSRALYWNLEFPKYQEVIHLDLYYKVKSLMKLSRNSLDQATNFLGIHDKNHVELEVWNRAKLGDKKSLEYVLDHNKRDVEILKELHKKLDGFRNISKRSL